MYFDWVKWVVLALGVIGAVWIGYRYYSEPQDGDLCRQDLDCRGEVCLFDASSHYCTRECASDDECLEGWRCLQPIERQGRHCIRPGR